MTELLLDIQGWLLALTLALPRMLTVFTVLPFLAEPVLPGLIRTGICISLTVVVLPLVDTQLAGVTLGATAFIVLIAKETILGLLIGYLIGLGFWTVGSVGSFIDNQRGALSAQLFYPLVGEQTSPLGGFLTQTMATLLFASGGFLSLMQLLYLSYVSWPVPSYYPMFNWAAVGFLLEQMDLLMYVMLLLAGPAVIIMLLAELGMALIGRFVPQINVFLLAMPVKSALALLLLVLYMTAMLHYVRDGFWQYPGLLNVLEELLR
ncbi:MAG: type III secretion system export apparatus subunit SctT [Candidatus Competibacteraceae bacterium]|nr:type III secretion system export apparatus subunit SctT [Candidatus Competibacteraceae bacterium]